MESIKKIFVVLVVGVNSVLAYSAQPNIIAEDQFAIIVDNKSLCHKELEERIKKFLDIDRVKISKQVFTEDSHLHLTNQKQVLFQDNPRQGYVGADKIFLLYFKREELFISLVDHKNRALNTKIIYNCIAKRVQK